MQLTDFANSIVGFNDWTHADKIKFFGWFVHSTKEMQHFAAADIRGCYEELGLDQPTSISPFLAAMDGRRPREAIKTRNGFVLERRIMDDMQRRFGSRPSTVALDRALSELPTRIPDLVERTYLDETLACLRGGAFRAAVVMAWNLAYAHLCDVILRSHIAEFNAQLPKSYPKADVQTVRTRDDFSELKESQILQVAKSASIISGSLHKVLKEKLDRRNVAAHPNGIVVSQVTAEDCIRDLVENVLLRL